MSTRVSTLALAGLLTAAACSSQQADVPAVARQSRPIYGGTLDSSPAHGAVVLLELYGGMGLCTGTLIAPRVVLTAAHCITSERSGTAVSPSSVRVGFGTYANGTMVYRNVQEVRPHPNYSSRGLDSDLGLIRLSSDAPAGIVPIPHLPATDPIMLSEDDPGNETRLVFSGFGETPNGSTGTKLTVADTLGLVCIDAYCVIPSSWLITTPAGQAAAGFQTICYDQRPGGPCSGDSGGPAFVTRNGVEYVAGVTSYGDQNCAEYGCSTKVDYYDAWIRVFIDGPKANGAPCVGAEECSSGFCVEGFCCNSACDHGSCGTCAAANGASANGVCTLLTLACDDGNKCTDNDRCSNGTCTGTVKDCTPANPCQTSVCQFTTGTCTPPQAKGENEACNDGNACTSGDKCVSGACVGAPQTTCPAPDQCHEAAACTNGQCAPFVAKPDGTQCFDGDGCTMNDTCRGGVCTGDAVVCPAPMECQEPAVCNPATGACGNYALKANGSSCTDLNPCTTGDQCVGGACLGTPMTSCPADCTGKAENAPCDDLDACTTGDSCRSGACRGFTKACPGGDCQKCNSANGACEFVPEREGGFCDDGNPCTEGDRCGGGICNGAAAASCCPAPDECKLDGSWDSAAKACVNAPKEDGAECSKGDCEAGVCVESACGCSSSGSAAPLAFALLGGLSMLRRRRQG